MRSRERLERAMRGESPDRIPFVLWRYFPEEDKSVEGLVDATLRYQKRWDFDLVKVTAPNRVWSEPWGGTFAPYNREVGFYPARELVVKDPRDWGKIGARDPRSGAFGEQIEVVRLLRRELGPEVPLIVTVFSPLTVGIELAGDIVHEHLRSMDRSLLAALDTITDTLCGFVRACVEEAGADGFFYVVQSARKGALSRSEYVRAVLPYDLKIFDCIRRSAWFNVLHLCKPNLCFEIVGDFPVQAVNWHDRGGTGPSLGEARKLFSGLLIGGLDNEGSGRFVSGVPEEAAAQAIDAIREVDGRGLMLGPGCCANLKTPEANIDAVQKAIANHRAPSSPAR